MPPANETRNDPASVDISHRVTQAVLRDLNRLERLQSFRSNSHGCTFSGLAIFSSQSTEAALRRAKTSNSWLRETPAKSAKELSEIPFFRA
jgi:hypothetical protein